MGRQAFTPRPDAADAVTVLGSAIRTARQDRGWTQQRLAAAIGVSTRTVLSIEQGAATASIGHVFSAVAVLGLPLFGTDADGWARDARAARHMSPLLPARVITDSRKVPADRDF